MKINKLVILSMVACCLCCHGIGASAARATPRLRGMPLSTIVPSTDVLVLPPDVSAGSESPYWARRSSNIIKGIVFLKDADDHDARAVW
jgi:hypothetical protein